MNNYLLLNYYKLIIFIKTNEELTIEIVEKCYHRKEIS